MSEELKPCPFCCGTNTEVRESTHWTGKSSQVISVTVMHWCDSSMIPSILQIKGKTREQALEIWNRRPVN